MNKKFPLVREDHPHDYDGYEFITLIKFNEKSFLTIVDNKSKKYIHGYVLDLCGPEEFNEERFIEIANEWYYANGNRYPISIEFSKRGMTEEVSNLLRVFPLDYVTRVIGPLPEFDMGGPYRIRKRKRKKPPQGILVVDNRPNR